MDSLLETASQILTRPGVQSLLLLLAAVFLILALLPRRGPRTLLAFRTPLGAVEVGASAITDLVQQTCAGIRGIGRVSVKVREEDGRLALRIRLQLEAPATLTDVAGTVQARVGDHLRHSFGFTEIGPIDLTVGGFTGNPAPDETARDSARPGREPTRPQDFAQGYDLPADERP